MAPLRKKLGELLVEAGRSTEAHVRAALAQQRTEPGTRLGALLVRAGVLAPEALARTLGQQYDLPFVKLPPIPRGAAALVPVDFLLEHRLVPFKLEPDGRGERVHVAVEDPTDLTTVDELRFHLRKSLSVWVAAADDLQAAIARVRAGQLVDDPLPVAQVVEEEPAVVQGEMLPASSDAALPDDWLTPAAPVPAPPLPPPPAPMPVAVARPPAPPPVAAPRLAPTPAAAPVPAPVEARPSFSDDDLKVLDSLDRMARGDAPAVESEKVKPARMVAALIRLLIKKGVVNELEFLEELSKK